MDAVEIILYVVVMIIWFIVQNARKKKLKEQQAQQRKETQFEETDTLDGPPRKSVSERSLIDEIIKELKEEDLREQVELEDDDYYQEKYQPEEKKSFETQSSNYKNYEKELKDIKSKARGVSKERFDNYKLPKEKVNEESEEENEYASLIFEDPDSPRKAIILSEILNRKHF